MSNDEIGLTIYNPDTKGAVIYVGVPATLTFTFTNQTGGAITLVPGSPGTASELDVFLPPFFTGADLEKMGISLPDWSFACDAPDQGLTLVYTGAGQVWADGDTLRFDVTGVESSAAPDSQALHVNYVNLKGGDVPLVTTATLTLNNPPEGHAKLTDVLQLSLENNGTVFVSDQGDPLQNLLTLTIKNTGRTPLCNGSTPGSAAPRVIVTFVYGSTSGALAPDNNRATPAVGSAWNIQAAILFSEGNDWTAQNPQPASALPHPQWVLQPANNNPEVIGTGASANISFSFSPVVSNTPPGHTQMTVQFTGFKKDENTSYDDAVWMLDIDKQSPPPTRGLVNFFSPALPLYTVTGPTQAVRVPLQWAMFGAAKVILVTSQPGVLPRTFTYPDPGAIGYGSTEVTLSGLAQTTDVRFTLDAYDGMGRLLNSMQYAVDVVVENFVDPRDGTSYPVVQAGNQFWMAQNLRYAAPDGSVLYDNQGAYAQQYGRLYSMRAAVSGIPAGWRLPTESDWRTLFGLFESPYAALLDGGTSGFDAQLGGRMTSDGTFEGIKREGLYWSSTADGGSVSTASFMLGKAAISRVQSPGYLSVRYVRDAN